MKHLLQILLLITLVLPLIHCDTDNCPSGPYYGDLKVKLTINDENPEVLVVVFEGNYERGDTIFSELVTTSSVTYEMEGDRFYSATAVYMRGPREIWAIDGKEMTVSDDDDDGCPYASDITLRLNLDN